MTNLFSAGEAMLAAAFEYGAVGIDYCHGSSVSSGIKAKLGKTLFRAEDNDGVTIRTEQRDFIVRAADIEGITPEVGDEIRFDGKRYMVTAPNNEPCWKWHTRQSHTQIRIHAKYNGEISVNE